MSIHLLELETATVGEGVGEEGGVVEAILAGEVEGGAGETLVGGEGVDSGGGMGAEAEDEGEGLAFHPSLRLTLGDRAGRK